MNNIGYTKKEAECIADLLTHKACESCVVRKAYTKTTYEFIIEVRKRKKGR